MLAPVQPLGLGPLELPRRGPLRVFYPKLYLGSSSFLSPEGQEATRGSPYFVLPEARGTRFELPNISMGRVLAQSEARQAEVKKGPRGPASLF